MNVELNTYSNNTIKILAVSGEMNAVTSKEVENRLTNLIMGGNKKLIVNLAGLNYISSAGLRVFLAGNKLIKKQKGELRISNLNDLVKEVFEISGFTMIFDIYPDEAAALEDF
jgi:anti-sigma B factor antagonist